MRSSRGSAVSAWFKDKVARCATFFALSPRRIQRAAQPEFVFSHAWREGDVIVWDNRAVLHRATYYDSVKHKRFMQRTTIGGDLPTVPQ